MLHRPLFALCAEAAKEYGQKGLLFFCPPLASMHMVVVWQRQDFKATRQWYHPGSPATIRRSLTEAPRFSGRPGLECNPHHTADLAVWGADVLDIADQDEAIGAGQQSIGSEDAHSIALNGLRHHTVGID